MKEIVEVIAKAIVNHPSEVQVEEERRGSTVVLKLHVAPDDMEVRSSASKAGLQKPSVWS